MTVVPWTSNGRVATATTKRWPPMLSNAPGRPRPSAKSMACSRAIAASADCNGASSPSAGSASSTASGNAPARRWLRCRRASPRGPARIARGLQFDLRARAMRCRCVVVHSIVSFRGRVRRRSKRCGFHPVVLQHPQPGPGLEGRVRSLPRACASATPAPACAAPRARRCPRCPRRRRRRPCAGRARAEGDAFVIIPAEVGPTSNTSTLPGCQPVSSTSSRRAAASSVSSSWSSPTSPAGISMVRAPSGTRYCSTNSTSSAGVAAITITAMPRPWTRSQDSQWPMRTSRSQWPSLQRVLFVAHGWMLTQADCSRRSCGRGFSPETRSAGRAPERSYEGGFAASASRLRVIAPKPTPSTSMSSIAGSASPRAMAPRLPAAARPARWW